MWLDSWSGKDGINIDLDTSQLSLEIRHINGGGRPILNSQLECIDLLMNPLELFVHNFLNTFLNSL